PGSPERRREEGERVEMVFPSAALDPKVGDAVGEAHAEDHELAPPTGGDQRGDAETGPGGEPDQDADTVVARGELAEEGGSPQPAVERDQVAERGVGKRAGAAGPAD